MQPPETTSAVIESDDVDTTSVTDSISEETKDENVMHGEAFTVKCKANIKITYNSYGGHEFFLQTDDGGKLICTEEMWDITEYKQ